MARRPPALLALALALLLPRSAVRPAGGSGAEEQAPFGPVPLHHGHHTHRLSRSQLDRLRQRCQGTRLRWCGLYQLQPPANGSTAAAPAQLQRAFSRPCPGQCSSVGVCNAITGLCDCPAGWTGPDCAAEQKRPCSAGGSKYNGPGTQPASHIGPDKRDLDWTDGQWTASRCAGICDDDKGLCFCDGPFGRIPAPPGSPPGTPPVRQGRPMGDWCHPSTTWDGRRAWGKMRYSDIYGPNGWCNVSVGTLPDTSCGCALDGTAGEWCELATEQFCPNSCSGRGRCDQGFCHCDAGFFGADCAGLRDGAQPGKPGGGGGSAGGSALEERPWLRGSLVPPQRSSGAGRPRPLIFVYDVPAWAATRMLQYRGAKGACAWRSFDADNRTVLHEEFLYGTETLIHEMLLQSPHRTLDPDEADFFFVPQYSSCFAFPVFGWADYPYWHSSGHPRVAHMARMVDDLQRHLQQHYPYWNRSGGADHVWLATHDEGACWFPRSVYDASIVLTHWGRTDKDHTSNTAWGPDDYSREKADPFRNNAPERWTHLWRGHACYTPGKDLVIPSLKVPSHYRWSPLLGAPPQRRTTLLYFRGDVGKRRAPNYSRGVRQALYRLCSERDWSAKFSVRIGAREDLPGDYSQHLASSKFCLVAPGDGWSARAEDAVLHGCVPVLVQDGVHAPFESILDWPSFSIRVPESQLEQLPELLLAVPVERLRELQAGVRRVWHRLAYTSQPLLREAADAVRREWRQALESLSLADEAAAARRIGQPDWDLRLPPHGAGGPAAEDDLAHRDFLERRFEPHASLDEPPEAGGGGGSSPAAVTEPHDQAGVGSAAIVQQLLAAVHAPAGAAATGGQGARRLQLLDAPASGPESAAPGGGAPASAGPAGAAAGSEGRGGAAAQDPRLQRLAALSRSLELSDEAVEDDALGTILAWLFAKHHQRRWHGRHAQHVRPPHGAQQTGAP